jgi:hypothetical protein
MKPNTFILGYVLLSSALVSAEEISAPKFEIGLNYSWLHVDSASGVRHTDCTLSSDFWARFTFSRMSEADAVQMKGLGRLL